MDASEIRPGGRGWDAFATSESKNAMFRWLLAGWMYNWWVGHWLSLSSLLLFIPGIFLASLAAIPGALVTAMKIRRVTEMKYGQGNVFELLGWTVWTVVNLAYVPILAILFARLINAW